MPPVATALTIAQLFANAAQAYGDRPAIEDAGHVISYRQLDQLRRQAARALLALDVQVGDRVAIWAPNVWNGSSPPAPCKVSAPLWCHSTPE